MMRLRSCSEKANQPVVVEHDWIRALRFNIVSRESDAISFFTQSKQTKSAQQWYLKHRRSLLKQQGL